MFGYTPLNITQDVKECPAQMWLFMKYIYSVLFERQ